MSADANNMNAWRQGISPERVGAVVRAALACDALEGRGAALFHDLDGLRARLGTLRSCFPADALHTLAVKANPVVEILRVTVASGAGLEAASIEETRLALAAGCPAAHVVYDSPAKTIAELADALTRGLCVNADGFDELARVADLGAAGSAIGLRVNPEVGEGSIAATSVAGPGSRFGVPISGAARGEALAAFRRYEWLTGLHVHIGSQGCPLELLVEGIGRVVDLAVELNATLGRPRITTLDIGGGLPWAYRPDRAIPDPAELAAALCARAPALFKPPFRIVTEFGRAVQAGCGFAASRVEYVKTVAGTRVAVIHFGADLFLRRVYRPEFWHHEFAVLGPEGQPKEGPTCPQTIAGPLCFAGDVLARDLELPRIEPGDVVVVRDAGAYTLSMWSRHCSRGMPAVYGFEGGSPPRLRLLLQAETPEDVVRCWSLR